MARAQRTVGENQQLAAEAGLAPNSYPFIALATVVRVGAVGAVQTSIDAGIFLNLNASPVYLEFWDQVAAPTLGVTAPSVIIPCPSNATAANGSGTSVPRTAVNSGTLWAAVATTPGGGTAVATGLPGNVWAK